MLIRQIWAQLATSVDVPGFRIGSRAAGGVDVYSSRECDIPQDIDPWDSPCFAPIGSQAKGATPRLRGKLGK